VSDQHIDPERAQFDAFKALPRDTPIHMLNLVRFRDEAAYPADHVYRQAVVHRQAAVETSRLIRCNPSPSPSGTVFG